MRLKANELKAQTERFPFFLLSALLLLALSFQLIALFSSPAWAESEAPKLTPGAQRVVYTAQKAIEGNDYDKAAQALQTFLKKYPKRNHYLVEFTLANAFSLSGREQKALSHYRLTLKMYPEFSYAWQNMGRIYFNQKQYGKAGDCLLKAHNFAQTGETSNLYYAAISYILAEEYNKALPHLRYLVSGKAGTPKIEWLEALLQACMELHLEDEAFRAVNLLLVKDGDNPRWWKFLAHLYLRQNNYKRAVAALTIRSYLTTINRTDIMLLGDLNNAIGVPAKAAQYYEQAVISKDDTKPSDYEKLASAYLAAHRPVKAREALEKALKKKPTSRLWFMLGQVLYEEEKWGDAYQAFTRSASFKDENGRSLLMMGYCALQMDKTAVARKAFRKAARFPKQRKTAKEMLKQIASLSKYSKQGK